MVTMNRLLGVLLFSCLLAGCASAPPAAENSCCAAPAPGTAKLSVGGQAAAGVSLWR
jgi:hypothetical protein